MHLVTIVLPSIPKMTLFSSIPASSSPNSFKDGRGGRLQLCYATFCKFCKLIKYLLEYVWGRGIFLCDIQVVFLMRIACIEETWSYFYVKFVFFLSINKLSELPKGFGACPTLEVLDLTYNNLHDKSFPGNFFYLGKSASLLQ